MGPLRIAGGCCGSPLHSRQLPYLLGRLTSATRVSAMAEQSIKTGGMFFIIEGVSDGVKRRENTNQTSGEVSINYVTNVTYWGGVQYCKVDPDETQKIKPGAWVKLRAAVRQFKDSMYPDVCTVLEVDGKAV
jgi:hypothetical protein